MGQFDILRQKRKVTTPVISPVDQETKKNTKLRFISKKEKVKTE